MVGSRQGDIAFSFRFSIFFLVHLYKLLNLSCSFQPEIAIDIFRFFLVEEERSIPFPSDMEQKIDMKSAANRIGRFSPFGNKSSLRIFFFEIRLVYVEYIEMFHEGSHLIFLLLKFREAFVIIEADFFSRRLMLHGDIVKSHGKGVRSFYDHQVLILQLTEGHEYREGVSHPVHLHVEHKTVHAVVRTS